MTIIFGPADISEMEAKYGVAYFSVAGGRTLLPATHAGDGVLACVSTDPGRGELINWKIWDATTGDLLLHGCERNLRAADPDPRVRYRGWFQCMRWALRWIRCNRDVVRVRPGRPVLIGAAATYIDVPPD